jgi:hypothetical protein
MGHRKAIDVEFALVIIPKSGLAAQAVLFACGMQKQPD